ncbi:Sterol regulatory element-binding protein ECM22 [Golovinomyces cichoracearum]|uniref:Sterol regulatory element-binding protein ECM22 n=1 Tax=Golovinomyces cichoracearum TaxID=62708 RepID=A0A420I8Z3_9PEZI|nr:Sterol regulatory element-binding protein ECM22 [Golovinomyces cichoracearum]
MDSESSRDRSAIATTSNTDATVAASACSSQAVRPQSKNKVPRLYHNKSRTGCQRCRARRVKCSETHPICTGCSRHGVDCVYDRGIGPARSSVNPSPKNSERRPSNGCPTMISGQTRVSQPSSLGIPENRTRRLLELRLFHNYIENVCHSLVVCNNVKAYQAWQFEVPRMALEQDGLLHEIFSMSALQILRTAPEDFDLRDAQRAYQSAARTTIDIELGRITRDNADAMWFASLLLQIDLFASLQGRNMEPYAPPLQWLEISRDRRCMLTCPPTKMSKPFSANVIEIIQSHLNLTDHNELVSAHNRESLAELLTLDRHEEMWDIDTQEAYMRTLSYIGSIRRASIEGEHNLVLALRIVSFPLIVPVKFIKFVEKQHPRALAMLASFFSIAIRHSEVWWMGTTPLREFQAIRHILPPQWQPLIGI